MYRGKNVRRVNVLSVFIIAVTVTAVSLGITYVVSLFRCNGRLGVTRLLKNKYGEEFVINGRDDDVYSVSPANNKNISFKAQGVSYKSVKDNYKASVWYTEGSKILEEYGIACNITAEDLEKLLTSDNSNDLYDGVSSYWNSQDEYSFVIEADDDILKRAQEVYELYSRLGKLKPFCSLPRIDEETYSQVGSSSYYIPVKIVDGDSYQQTRFSVNKEYTENEVYDKIRKAVTECRRKGAADGE